MIILYSGEGTNDEAVMEALKEMWCPTAKIEKTQYRGSSKRRRKQEIRKACVELSEKEASLIVFFTDSNDRDYQVVKRNESEWIPENYRPRAIYAVADRNIECWIVADNNKARKEIGIKKRQLEADPIKPVNRFFGTYRDSEKIRKIKEYVKNSDLKEWLNNSRSFKSFYNDCKRSAISLGCDTFPNIR